MDRITADVPRVAASDYLSGPSGGNGVKARLAQGWTIGQLARTAGVGVETIRYYERCGLIAQPAKPRSGYRRYGEEALARLAFIQTVKQMGFSLDEIVTLMPHRMNRVAFYAAFALVAEGRLRSLRSRIAQWTRYADLIHQTLESCDVPSLTALPDREVGRAANSE